MNQMRVFGDLRPPARAGDAGFDLTARYPASIPSKGRATIDTGIQIEIPEGCCGIIIGRSSLNTKGITCVVGLVDSGYRGAIRVVLANDTETAYQISAGDRVAQIVIVPFAAPALLYVTDGSDLEASERGALGFGSTGK